MFAVINHPYINEVQTVSQIFFPNSRFSFKQLNEQIEALNWTGAPAEEPSAALPLTALLPAEGYSFISILYEQTASARVYLDGKFLSSRSWPLGESAYITERRALMLALFYAFKEVTEVFTPWGSLTGIRPSKMARMWMDEGMTDGEIASLMAEPFGCMESKAKLAVKTARAEKALTEQIYMMAGGYNPVGLYISVPFCPSRCLYCSFNMGKNYKDEKFYAEYVGALEKDLAAKAETFRGMDGILTSLYIGGGTPTALPSALLERLLASVEKFFGSRVIGMEYTAEAGRPDSLNEEKLKLLKDFGVNRIAVNPQTLNDATLKTIGRNHTAADFFTAFELARKTGFRIINTDIIAGLPGETAEDMERTVNGIIKLAPENITVHTLAVKRASRLNENLNDYSLDNTQEVGRMLKIAGEACEAAGHLPYYLYRQKNMVGLFENTGYSLPGRECLYNVGMMAETQTVLGAGAGAVCKFVDGSKITRAFNVKNPEVYVERMCQQ